MPARPSKLPVPPGHILADELEARGLTQTDFTRKIRRPLQVVNEIIRAKKSITAETALAFEKALGVPAETWLALESAYQLARARKARKRSA
jgi:HTH-type transcriptional regulator/antitoxin HigA